MIQPANDVIFVRFENGRAEPLALEELAARIAENEGPTVVQPWVAEQLAHAIFHYLRTELKRDWVSGRELFWILRAAVDGLVRARQSYPRLFEGTARPVVETDLHNLAIQCGGGFELAFFDKLGGLVADIERQHPAVIRFTRLRPCVKTIVGAQLWSRSCQRLSEEILAFVRGRIGKAGTLQTSLLLIS